MLLCTMCRRMLSPAAQWYCECLTQSRVTWTAMKGMQTVKLLEKCFSPLGTTCMAAGDAALLRAGAEISNQELQQEQL